MNGKYNEEKAVEILRKNLPPRRFKHTMGVVEMAEEYARMLGVEDIQTVRTAALLHDCAKHMKSEELISYANEHGITVTEDYMKAPHLLHGPVGAVMAREVFGVQDERVFSIIERHTLGAENMTVEEKIVFLADFTEKGRRYGASAQIRDLSRKDFDLALIRCSDEGIKHLLTTNAYIHPLSILTRNSFIEEYKQKHGEIK
ncbi:MAG: HD domain-containing protein [Anaerofustis stercorihominis]|nr:HD domain-containing protein [Anaerofustis stercorihominis]